MPFGGVSVVGMNAPEIRRLAQSTLTAKQYDAWKLVEWEGLSKRQAARLLGIDHSSLISRYDGACRRLQPVLKAHLEGTHGP